MSLPIFTTTRFPIVEIFESLKNKTYPLKNIEVESTNADKRS